MKSSLKIFEMFETLLFFFKQKHILFLETYLKRFLALFAVADIRKQICLGKNLKYYTGKTY